MTFNEWFHYGSLALSYGSSAVVFYWMAMTWQKRTDLCFFLLALSSGLIVLIGVMDFFADRQGLHDAEYLTYWYCRQTTVAIDAFLFPWGIWRLFKYLDRVAPPTEVK